MANKVSVVICTYNRAESLTTTLQSIFLVEIPLNWEYEVLLVDNNSTDSTKEVVSSFIEKGCSSLRYLHEHQQGLSYARNSGMREANGEIVVFTDDDVIVEGDWLVELVKAFVDCDADCVGGKIKPVWPGKKPLWLSNRNENILAVLDYGDDLKEMGVGDEPLFGANFAFSKRILDKVGYFNTSLGRMGNKLYGSEDTEMFSRIFKMGGRVIYQPRAVVHHILAPHRLEKSYFRKWHYDAGEGLGLSLGHYTHRNLWGVPYYLVREFLNALGRYMAAIVTFKPDSIFYQEQKVIFYFAFIRSRLKVYSSYGG
jgi:glycosyltransferase involved in cell wall biosynthesis